MTNRELVREVVEGVLLSAVGILPPNRVAKGIADALYSEGLIAPEPPEAYRIDRSLGRTYIMRKSDGVCVAIVSDSNPVEITAMLDALNAMGGEGDR